MQRVLTGIDVLQAHQWAPLRGLTVGLIAHPASVDDTLAIGTRKAPRGQWSEYDSALVDMVFAGEQLLLRRRFF